MINRKHTKERKIATRNPKVYLKSFGHNLKLLVFSKRFLIFFSLFLILDFFFSSEYLKALTSFSLTANIFSLIDPQTIHPTTILSNQFDCAISQCDPFRRILFALILLLESFVLFSFIRPLTKISKKLLGLYGVLLQFLFIIPILTLGFAPDIAVNSLNKRAEKDLITVIQQLENPSKNNIESDLSEIYKKISNQKNLPVIIEDFPKEQAILATLHIKKDKKESLYKAAVIPYQLAYSPELAQQKEKIQFQILFFPDNTLIVQSFNNEIIEKLIPVFAEKLVKSEFNKQIKQIATLPIVNVPNEKEYLVIRKQEEEKRKNELLTYITNIKNNMSLSQSAFSKNEANIKDVNAEYDRYKAYGEDWARNCKRDFGDEKCREGEQTISSNLTNLLNYKEENIQANKDIQINIQLAQSYLYTAQKSYEDFLNKPSIPENEGGVFVPPNTIHLKYFPLQKMLFSCYLITGVHEYLHFFSYATSNSNNVLPVFIDEGITDYLALVVNDSFLKKQTQCLGSGYPNEIEIIKTIIKITSEDKLQDIYFSKDENELENYIDNYFSKGMYEEVKNKGNLLDVYRSNDALAQVNIKEEIIKLLTNKQATISGQKN